jgi:hypothetical protein
MHLLQDSCAKLAQPIGEDWNVSSVNTIQVIYKKYEKNWNVFDVA